VSKYYFDFGKFINVNVIHDLIERRYNYMAAVLFVLLLGFFSSALKAIAFSTGELKYSLLFVCLFLIGLYLVKLYLEEMFKSVSNRVFLLIGYLFAGVGWYQAAVFMVLVPLLFYSLAVDGLKKDDDDGVGGVVGG